MKYIDIEKLKAEIEKRMEKHWDNLPDADSPEDDWTHNELCELGAYKELEHIEDFLNSLYKELEHIEERINSLQQEQPEVDLEKFVEKIKTFQGRYKHPEIVSIKGAMAFMARMFYQYPNVARLWYEQLPKVTMDNTRKEENK